MPFQLVRAHNAMQSACVDSIFGIKRTDHVLKLHGFT